MLTGRHSQPQPGVPGKSLHCGPEAKWSGIPGSLIPTVLSARGWAPHSLSPTDFQLRGEGHCHRKAKTGTFEAEGPGGALSCLDLRGILFLLSTPPTFLFGSSEPGHKITFRVPPPAQWLWVGVQKQGVLLEAWRKCLLGGLCVEAGGGDPGPAVLGDLFPGSEETSPVGPGHLPQTT